MRIGWPCKTLRLPQDDLASHSAKFCGPRTAVLKESDTPQLWPLRLASPWHHIPKRTIGFFCFGALSLFFFHFFIFFFIVLFFFFVPLFFPMAPKCQRNKPSSFQNKQPYSLTKNPTFKTNTKKPSVTPIKIKVEPQSTSLQYTSPYHSITTMKYLRSPTSLCLKTPLLTNS